MSRPKKPINYEDELSRINARITHYQNTIEELTEKRNILSQEKETQDIANLSKYLHENNLSLSQIVSQLNL